MRRVAVFVFGSIAILTLSRHSLNRPGSHGFYRHFAFQAILAILVSNAQRWFAKPRAPRQLASWTLLAASLGMAVHGFYLLRTVGRPAAGQAGTEGLLHGIEDTSQLVRVGAYRYIRHPLYASLLFLCWGAVLKRPTVLPVLLGNVATFALSLTAEAEEDENRARFGAEYDEYCRHTRRFVPFVF